MLATRSNCKSICVVSTKHIQEPRLTQEVEVGVNSGAQLPNACPATYHDVALWESPGGAGEPVLGPQIPEDRAL